MHEIIQAIILGIIQGLTEFLPVSSSGHLELAKYFFNENTLPEESLLMTIILHGGTALSTVVIFRKDILTIFQSLFRFQNDESTRLALKILLSMIPAGLIGFFLEDTISFLFDRQILLVGAMLWVTGLLLLLADKARNTLKDVSYANAFVIGIAQAIAILPGISRSGATIATSVMLGNDRGKAARFSFLMVLPLIFGKIAKDMLDADLSLQTANLIPLSVGFLAAFITGLFACTWMIKLVKSSQLWYFALYCFLVGAVAMGMVLFPIN